MNVIDLPQTRRRREVLAIFINYALGEELGGAETPGELGEEGLAALVEYANDLARFDWAAGGLVYDSDPVEEQIAQAYREKLALARGITHGDSVKVLCGGKLVDAYSIVSRDGDETFHEKAVEMAIESLSGIAKTFGIPALDDLVRKTTGRNA